MRCSQLVLQLCCLVGLSLTSTARACSCAVGQEPTLLKSFQEVDAVVVATLLKILPGTSTTYGELDLRYSAKLLRAWKGCNSFKGVDVINVTTASNDGICGVTHLKLGTTYLFSGSLDASRQSVHLHICKYYNEWKYINATEVESLSKKYSNCTCTSQSCGKRTSTYLCPDGVTMAGPRTCSYNQKQATCAWEIVQCPTCQKQSDCRKGQFCSYGKCRTAGTCRSDVDCWNPQNTFNKNCTTGRPRCSARNKCYLNCSQTCGTGAACVADPCKVTPCKAPHVSCARNYCGGCNAIFYNSSGYQVCN